MNDIINRLKLATAKYSLREIGTACGISHERIRQIAFSSKNNVTMITLERIESGLNKLNETK